MGKVILCSSDLTIQNVFCMYYSWSANLNLQNVIFNPNHHWRGPIWPTKPWRPEYIRIWKVPFFRKIHFEYILIWNYWKNHVKSVLKAYNWWLQGHCLWVYRVPQVGMEADATAQFCLVMLEYATILSHMHCYHVTPLMPAGHW